MDLTEHAKQSFNHNIQTGMESLPVLVQPLVNTAELIVGRLLEGGKVLSCGSGAEAAIAQLFATHMLNRFDRERPGLPALSLAVDAATLTSIADDYDYDEVFAKQVRALGHPGDLLVAITTGGNDGTVNAAVEAAHEREMFTIAFTGKDGGRAASLLREVDIELRVPSDNDARIRETHLLGIHCLCDLIDKQLLGS
ncbi:MAG: SIS domain-containing protein [Sedimenticola sp.]